ncbi:MAG: hypothetical protein AB3N22_01330 [Ruegeria sp.]
MIGFARDILARLTARPEAHPALPPSPLIRAEDRLSIPVAERNAEDLAGPDALKRGRHLARQEMWAELSAEMRAADQARAAAHGGTPVAELLALGAHSDVTLAVDHALAEDVDPDDPRLVAGIRALEAVLDEHDGDPMIALVVARAHMEIGGAWRGTGWDATLSQLNRERCAAHFDRAAEILTPLFHAEPDSIALALARCALLAGRPAPDTNLADAYEALINLDSENPRHMRALGTHLLPRWSGSYDALELEARRTAAGTQEIWGAAGYTWVYFDAITQDEEACARVDVPFFLDGLRDILQRHPEQEMINLLAAYCAIALPAGLGLHEEADLVRVQLCEAADWLIREHLTELHPLIWAHAAEGFDNTARLSSPRRFAARGRADALQALAAHFRAELRQGQHITFTPTGLHCA